MNLLLVESVTAGAFDSLPETALLPEAEAMLGAMVAEAVARSATTSTAWAVRVLRHHGLPWSAETGRTPAPHGLVSLAVGGGHPPAIESVRVPLGDWARIWGESLDWADAVWLVAPETGRQLETLSRAVEASGARLLGPTADAVAVAASKSATQAALAGRVRQPRPAVTTACWVIKPDDGVAAEGVWRVPAQQGREGAPAAPPGCMVEPFVEGEALSLSVLSDGREALVLAVNRQCIEWCEDGRARYRGGVANAIADRGRFAPLAQAVQDAIPGLWGCWGIDCVLPADGEPVLIEVNPRLTTAFAHLREATGLDLLGALLELEAGRTLQEAPAGRPVAFDVPSLQDATA